MDALHREALSSLRLTWAPTTDDLWRRQDGLHVSGLNEGPLNEVMDAVADAVHQPEASPLGVVLRGQAGSGKTHMLGQVRERVQADGGYFFIVELLDATSFWQSARAGILESLGRPGVQHETQLKDLLWELASVAHVSRADRRAIVGDDELTPDIMESFVTGLYKVHRETVRQCRHTLRSLVLLGSLDFGAQDIGQAYLSSNDEPAGRGAWGLSAPTSTPQEMGPPVRMTASRRPARRTTGCRDEEWVHRHWIPFDEQALKVELGLGPARASGVPLQRPPRARRPARRRGVAPRALPTGSSPRGGASRAQRRAVLRERDAADPDPRPPGAAHLLPRVPRVPRAHNLARAVRHAGRDISALRQQGTVLRGDRGAGRCPARTAAIRPRGDDRQRPSRRRSRAARPGRVSRTESGPHARALMCWLQRPPITRDPANPYGKNRFLHGQPSRRLAEHRPRSGASTSAASSGSGSDCRRAAGRSRNEW